MPTPRTNTTATTRTHQAKKQNNPPASTVANSGAPYHATQIPLIHLVEIPIVVLDNVFQHVAYHHAQSNPLGLGREHVGGMQPEVGPCFICPFCIERS